MAKVSFTKLGLSKDKLNEITMIEFNGQSIEVKQYLPIINYSTLEEANIDTINKIRFTIILL